MKKGYKRFNLIADMHNHLKFCLIKVLTFYRELMFAQKRGKAMMFADIISVVLLPGSILFVQT